MPAIRNGLHLITKVIRMLASSRNSRVDLLEMKIEGERFHFFAHYDHLE